MAEVIPLAITIVICAALVVSLAMVLTHLGAMRAKTGEIALMQEQSRLERQLTGDDLAKLRADLDNEKAKLTQLSNRVR